MQDHIFFQCFFWEACQRSKRNDTANIVPKQVMRGQFKDCISISIYKAQRLYIYIYVYIYIFYMVLTCTNKTGLHEKMYQSKKS